MSIEPGILGHLGEVQVNLSVELGRTDLPLKDVLNLQQGSVVSLNRLTDELLDVTANGKPIARAEIVAQDGRFALRVVELVGPNNEASAPAWPPAGASAAPVNAPVSPAEAAQVAGLDGVMGSPAAGSVEGGTQS